MTRSLAYLWLEAKRQWRNREILIFRLGLPTAIYLILNAANGDNTSDSPGGRVVAVAALGAVISGLAAGPSLGDERANGWLRQLRTTPLRPSAAVAAKMVVAMSFALPAIALVVAAAGLVGDNQGTALGWAESIKLVGLMWLPTAPPPWPSSCCGWPGASSPRPARCPTPWPPSPRPCPPGAWSRSARAWPAGLPCPPRRWRCWPPGRSVPARWPRSPGGGSSPDSPP
jgi:hypothetical protein